MEPRLEARTLLATMREMASLAVITLLLFVGLITAVGTVLDLAGKSPFNFLNTIVSLVAGYLLLRAMLLAAGLAEAGSVAAFGSYFGMSLLEGLGIIAGVLLLIVPGIILAVRWSVAGPYLLCERSGVSDALGRSFERTKGSGWIIFGVSLLGALPILAAALIGGIAGALSVTVSDSGPPDLLLSVVDNALGAVTSAYFTVLSVAAYKLLFRPHLGIAEVFA
jgi:hypothetical protein